MEKKIKTKEKDTTIKVLDIKIKFPERFHEKQKGMER